MTNVSASSMMVIYTYRADGLRHSKTVNGVTTTHVWLRGNIILERNDSGAIINQFDRSLTGRLIRSEQHGYYLHNARGDIVQRVNAQGGVIRNYRYTAFGIELNPSANNRNPFRFAGEYWDAETGTYYLRARNFNPRTGRFTQPDPHWGIQNMQSSTNAILQAGNLYMYAMHNPVRWVDPLGLFVVLPSGGVQLPSGIVLRPGAMTLPRDSSTVSNNVWFPLRSAVENSGGSVAWSAGTSTATVALWGMTARFNASMDGVRLGGSNIMRVRSDVFARELLNEIDFNLGVRVVYKNNRLFKDVTAPVNTALASAVAEASALTPAHLRWFYNLVSLDAPWDIKIPAQWEETIGTTFHGRFDTPIHFRGSIMTPESLGNWTYGYIGRALGLSLDILLAGSWYAADFPTGGADWVNERGDWSYIARGFRAHGGFRLHPTRSYW